MNTNNAYIFIFAFSHNYIDSTASTTCVRGNWNCNFLERRIFDFRNYVLLVWKLMMSKGIEFTKLKPIAQTENRKRTKYSFTLEPAKDNMRLNSLLQTEQITRIKTVVTTQLESAFNRNKSVSKWNIYVSAGKKLKFWIFSNKKKLLHVLCTLSIWFIVLYERDYIQCQNFSTASDKMNKPRFNLFKHFWLLSLSK